MKKALSLVLVLGLAGCGGHYIPVPQVKDDAPVSQLNPDRWNATVNDLMTPPEDGSSRPLPAPVYLGTNKVPTSL